MSDIKVVIVEDEFFVAEHLSGLAQDLGYKVTEIYHSGAAFLKSTDYNFDVALLDIFLSDNITGLDIAEKLKERLKPFVFLTANQDDKTLQKAASLGPKGYITKPFKDTDVSATLQILTYGLAPKLTIRGVHGVEELNVNEILFIKADGAYISIQTTDQKIVQRKLLREVKDELPAFFERVHRSYLVNTKHINSRMGSSIVVHNFKIPISKKQ